jgi:hypothetical protein
MHELIELALRDRISSGLGNHPLCREIEHVFRCEESGRMVWPTWLLVPIFWLVEISIRGLAECMYVALFIGIVTS